MFHLRDDKRVIQSDPCIEGWIVIPWNEYAIDFLQVLINGPSSRCPVCFRGLELFMESFCEQFWQALCTDQFQSFMTCANQGARKVSRIHVEGFSQKSKKKVIAGRSGVLLSRFEEYDGLSSSLLRSTLDAQGSPGSPCCRITSLR